MTCHGLQLYEDIEHFVLRCPALTEVRRRLIRFTEDYVVDKPVLKPICDAYLSLDNEALCM